MNSRPCLSILSTCILLDNSGNTDEECCYQTSFYTFFIGKNEKKSEHIGSVTICITRTQCVYFVLMRIYIHIAIAVNDTYNPIIYVKLISVLKIYMHFLETST